MTSDIVTSIYGRNLVALHMKFLKDLRRHHKCRMPVLDKNGGFVSGYIWSYDKDSEQVTTKFFHDGSTPEILVYESLESAWEDYKKELEENLKEF